MNSERVIIIDNRRDYVEQIKSLLEELGFERGQIWPPDPHVFTNWADALETLTDLKTEGFDPKQTQCYLLLDLALDTSNASYGEGISQIARSKEILREYISVALTVWAAPARRELLGEHVDGVIERTSTQGGGAAALQYGLGRALDQWVRRTGRHPVNPRVDSLVADSPGARNVQSAISQHGINRIVRQEAASWSDVAIDALTGGYSGAHILRISGSNDGTRVSIVCKISRDKTSLEDEVERSRRASASYHVYVGCMAPYQTHTPKDIDDDIGNGSVYYIVQASIPGKSVEDVLTQSLPTEERQGDLKTLITRVRELGDALNPSDRRGNSSLPALSLTAKDVDVFTTSADLLSRLLEVGREQFGTGVEMADRSAVDRLTSIVKDWNTLIEKEFRRIPHVAQHGDFNVRNLFVTGDRLQLIDFARYGFWPIGYDLTRLELQLLLRGIDTATHLDHFPSRMGHWMSLWRDLKGTPQMTVTAEHHDILDLARTVAVDRQKLCAKLSPDWYPATEQERLIALMRTFDAIKICSYQDASIFKRLWFLQIAIDSARSAGLMH